MARTCLPTYEKSFDADISISIASVRLTSSCRDRWGRVCSNALVTSRLEYCNSLLYGTVNKNFARLQHLQYTAARLIMRMPKYSNITPVLKELHWLREFQERASFKIMLLVNRAVNCRGPVYLRGLICICTPTRSRRSAGTKQLKRPK